MGHDGGTHDRDDSRETHERLALPLLVPAIVFLFAVLSIYGLSRIYLELDTYHVGDVGMATPLAIGVAILILLVASYLASRPVPMWQMAFIGMVAAGLLTGGSIWAAVHEEKEIERVAPNGDQTPGPGGEGIAATLDEFSITLAADTAPGGSIAFDVTNGGSQQHEFVVISSDLAPEDLPYIEDDFIVDETQLDVIGKIPRDDLQAGTTASMTFDMPEGSYVIICNVPAHYDNGMRAAFSAGPPAPGGPAPDGEAPPGGEGVEAALSEFEIALAEDNAPGGSVTFNVTNGGNQQHEFVVISSDLAPEDLPYIEDDFVVDETQIDIIGRIPTDDLQAGATASMTFQMPEGSYVIICNVASHYESGMHSSFTAGPAPGG